MRECIKLEWERVTKSKLFYTAIIIGIIIAVMQIMGEVYPRSVNVLKYYSGKDGEPYSLYMWSMCMNVSSLYKAILVTIFPVLAMMPHALSYHFDIKSGYIKNLYTRTDKINYLVAKYMVTFVSGGMVIVIPYIVNFVIAACMLPALNPIQNGQFNSGGAMLQGLYYGNPLLYIVVYLIINWVYAGAFATMTLAATYFVDNIFLLSMVPFVIWYGMGIISQYTVKAYNVMINPIRFVDIAQGYIVHPVNVIGTFLVVTLLSAVIYFVIGVRSDAV